MPTIKPVGGKIRYSIERFDGGLNTKDSPSRIGPFETPECLNVTFDDRGSVATRDGTSKWNTTAIGAFPIDHGISYNQEMIVWSNGTMYRTSGVSGTTFLPVTTSSGKFQTGGTKIAAVVYQNVLFCSDGTNGPWKYTGAEKFYNMGIDIPSAPTGASNGAGSISTGTYYYGVSFVNSQVVESEIGSASVAVTTTGSSTIRVSQIPVGSGLAGVNERWVYRADAASGPFRRVGVVAGNTTTTFDDTIANGAEGKLPIEDSTKPKAFKTVELHKERLFFDSFDDRTFVRYTDFANPYITSAENEEPINQGDGEDIIAVASQDDFITIFKKNKSFVILTQDPSDDLTWIKKELPANIGIIGPKAFIKIQNGLIFVGRQNNRLTGLHFLSGVRLNESSDGKMRSVTISEKIEYDLLNNLNSSYWSNMHMELFDNRLFLSYTPIVQTTNSKLFWLDLTRVGSGGQPGSWAPWSGFNAGCLFQHNGVLCFGDSSSTGFVRRFFSGSYSDSGSAINSYFWTKEYGGEQEGTLDSYIKELRELYVWHEKLGNYFMNVRVRVDGDLSVGSMFQVDLSPNEELWGSMIWGTDPWGGGRGDFEERISIGSYLGKRFQVRFDNQNTLNQGFTVHRLESGFNLRRRR